MSQAETRSVLHLPRIVVTSTCGGGGKTLLSLGLARALRNKNWQVLPFKKGPDYIDAAWLSMASGNLSTNLDPYFLDGAGLRAQMQHAVSKLLPQGVTAATIAIIEGNRGLFDGLDLEGSCSTAALSRQIQAPVLLTLNVTKMTRTVAALLQGLAGFEPVDFAGVVLNCTGSPRHAAYLRSSIEHYTDFTVLGELPRLTHNPLPERHMGLASFRGDKLSETAEEALETLAAYVNDHVDVQAIVERAAQAQDLHCGPLWSEPALDSKNGPCIGYVRDECLWFYYHENLEALERAGARLVKLSLFDSSWPLPGKNGTGSTDSEDSLDAIYLGGGFPEDCLDRLAGNGRLADLAALAAQGFPIYAECGGLMVLSRSLRKNGVVTPMAGVLPLDIEIGPRPVGLGYVMGEVVQDNPYYPRGTSFPGHEFHYSRACGEKTAAPVLALSRGRGLGDGMDALVINNTWASYTHIFAPAQPAWAPALCRLAAQWRANKAQERRKDSVS